MALAKVKNYMKREAKEKQKLKLLELEAIDKSCYSKTLEPAFPQCRRAIVFECSDFFVPYQSVVLQSLIDHISPEGFYDIVILTHEIDAYDCRLLTDITKGKANVSLRFFDPTKIVKNFIKKAKYKYLDINYYRLALPWIFKEYDTVLNLGADIVIQKDIYEILKLEWKESEYMAGVIDLGYIGRLSLDIPIKELDLKDPNGYVNADVLLFNLEAIRNNFTLDEVMGLWQKYHFRCSEQDAFNVLYDCHIRHMDLRWNLFPDKMASVEHIAYNNDTNICLWEKSLKDPWIIHFAAYPKPWDYPLVGFGDKWWYYARKSMYYEEILRRMSVIAVRGDLSLGKKWIQKVGDIFLPIFPRDSFFRNMFKYVYSVFFSLPDKEFGRKFGKLGGK